MCEGLEYAHEATDSDGKLLGIVHRDISPPNVLISKKGEGTFSEVLKAQVGRVAAAPSLAETHAPLWS